MTIAPARPSSDAAQAEAIFAAARQRRRRIRRHRLAAGLIAVVLAAAAALLASRPQHQQAPGRAHAPAPAHLAGRLPAARVAWVDYNARLHIGSLATGHQRVAAVAEADPVVPLTAAGDRLYWVDTAGTYWQIQSLDLATGKIADLGDGIAVFAAADGRHVFIAQTAQNLTEFPAAGGRSRSLSLPAGWFVAGLAPEGATPPAAVAAGILVQARDPVSPSRPTRLAAWNPESGRLTLIGRGAGSGGLLGAVTPPGASYSLVAWWRGSCYPSSCTIEITNTATRSTRVVRSPLGHGFAYGVAFSPDGGELAAFANSSGLSTTPARAELTIISTRTGFVRLVPRVSLLVGEDVAWARWLPGGRLLLAGGTTFSGVVDPGTLAVRPYYFVRGRDHYIEDSQDVNYSAVVLKR